MRSHLCKWTVNYLKRKITVCVYVYRVADVHLGMIPGPTYKMIWGWLGANS